MIFIAYSDLVSWQGRYYWMAQSHDQGSVQPTAHHNDYCATHGNGHYSKSSSKGRKRARRGTTQAKLMRKPPDIILSGGDTAAMLDVPLAW